MSKPKLLNQLKHGLTVSCQALPDEPLHSPFIMAKMAKAAKLGGAVAIRANGHEDIAAIRAEVDLPIIGIVKKDYSDSPIYITPTLAEVEELVTVGCSIIAVDATNRIRPGGTTLQEFYQNVREVFPDLALMADISTFEEGVQAMDLGFDLVATTLAGYTPYTENVSLPALSLVEQLARLERVPVMAEGGYWQPEQLNEALRLGAHGCIVGSAITRPFEITKRFVTTLQIEESTR